MATNRSRLADRLRLLSPGFDSKIVEAFRTVERSAFLDQVWAARVGPEGDEWHREELGDDSPLYLFEHDSSVVTAAESQGPLSVSTRPSLMADMLQALDLDTGDSVLEIGTGTGYNAALIAELVGPTGSVTSYELEPGIADRARANLRVSTGFGSPVRVVAGDAYEARLSSKTFDKIIVTAACADISDHWLDALKPFGRLLAPLDYGGVQPLVKVERNGSRWVGHPVGWSTFMPARGAFSQDSAYPDGLIVRDVHQFPIFQSQAWPSYGSGPVLRYLSVRSDEADFYFYLALRDGRATWTPWGPGLSTDEAWTAAGKGIIRSQGDASTIERLSTDLDTLYQSWQAEGFPSVFDYEIEFASKDGSEHPDSLSQQRFSHWLLHKRLS